MKRLLPIAFALVPALAQAQSSPGWTTGYFPTAAQWNAAFAAKQDYINGTTSLPALSVTGTSTLTGATTIGSSLTVTGPINANGALNLSSSLTSPSFESLSGNSLTISSGGNGTKILFGDPSYGIGSTGEMDMGANANAALWWAYGTMKAQWYTTPANTYIVSGTYTPVLNMPSSWGGTITGAGPAAGLFTPYIFTIPTDTMNAASSTNGAGVFQAVENLNTGAKGGRAVGTFSLNIASAITGDTSSQQYTGLNLWNFASASAGGTGSAVGQGKGSTYGLNPQIVANSAATNYSLFNVWGEGDLNLQTGSSVTAVYGRSTVLQSSHAVSGTDENVLDISMAGYGSVPTWTAGYQFGSHGAMWPMASSATLLGTSLQQFNGASSRNVPFPNELSTYGVDFKGVNFVSQSGKAFRSDGFYVDGTGQIGMQNVQIGAASGGAAVDIPNPYVVTAVAPAVAATPTTTTNSSIGSYYPGDDVIGTAATPGRYRITSVQAVAAALTAGGTGGTTGTQTVTLASGSGVTCSVYPQFSVTISGGAITGVNSVVTGGNCTAIPTTPNGLAALNVTGAGLTGAQLAIGFGALNLSVLVPDSFASCPGAGGITPIGGSGVGLTLTPTCGTKNVLTLNPTGAFVSVNNSSPTSANASFTVSDGGGAATYGNHIGFLQTTPLTTAALSSCGTTPAIDATASDTAGTITEGTTATGCTIAFAKSYATTPHVMITSWAANSTPVVLASVSTTGFTVSNTSASGNKFTYWVVQ